MLVDTVYLSPTNAVVSTAIVSTSPSNNHSVDFSFLLPNNGAHYVYRKSIKKLKRNRQGNLCLVEQSFHCFFKQVPCQAQQARDNLWNHFICSVHIVVEKKSCVLHIEWPVQYIKRSRVMCRSEDTDHLVKIFSCIILSGLRAKLLCTGLLQHTHSRLSVSYLSIFYSQSPVWFITWSLHWTQALYTSMYALTMPKHGILR